jgi:hypothetical protein
MSCQDLTRLVRARQNHRTAWKGSTPDISGRITSPNTPLAVAHDLERV